MAITHDATVSGAGDEIWSADYSPIVMRAVVTIVGGAEQIDLVTPSRYLHIGWWAPIENFVADADYGTDVCMLEPRWLYGLFQKTNLEPGIAAYGIDGFHYDLAPGITVRFVWHQ